MPSSKEKRTKEQVMRLLDRAIEQEETLLEKVKTLEMELADCRKKAENPRHELEEQALPKSKVSFRLDFYRMEEKGPLKGIIEHLSSRESRSFEGDRWGEIGDFITQFVGAATWPMLAPETSSLVTESKKSSENGASAKKKGRNTLSRKQFPEVVAEAAPKKLSDSEPLDTEPFLVLTQNAATDQRAVQKALPFQIEISQQVLAEFRGKPCTLKIKALSLEQKSNPGFELTEHPIPDQKALRIAIPAHSLAQGIYRLVLSITLSNGAKNGQYRASRLLIVQ